MEASAFPEASGKTCSRTSARVAECAEAVVEVELGALADGKVSVCTEAGVGLATGAASGCATMFFSGFFSGFFSAVAFGEFDFGGAADGFGAGGTSRRAGCSTALGCAAAVEAEEDDSGRRPRIFGSAKIATMTRSPAATGTT